MEMVKQDVAGIERSRETTELKEVKLKIEEFDREKRKKNLLFFNLIESTKNEATGRYKDDENIFREIVVNELAMMHIVPDKLIRLGKRMEGRRRPLLIKLKEEEEKRGILQNAKKLRNSSKYPRVYIGRDQTRDEREREKELRQEIKDKNNNESEGLFIRRGKIVRRLEARNEQEDNRETANEQPEPEQPQGGRELETQRDF